MAVFRLEPDGPFYRPLAKVGGEGSNPFARFIFFHDKFIKTVMARAKLIRWAAGMAARRKA